MVKIINEKESKLKEEVEILEINWKNSDKLVNSVNKILSYSVSEICCHILDK